MTCKKFQNPLSRSISAHVLNNKQIFTDARSKITSSYINLSLSFSPFSIKTMILKELPIGSIVKFKGIRLRICEAIQKCRGCYFRTYTSCPYEIIGVCCRPWRKQDIILRKLDKNKQENNHTRYKKRK